MTDVGHRVDGSHRVSDGRPECAYAAGFLEVTHSEVTLDAASALSKR
jgi:hypothetical protein